MSAKFGSFFGLTYSKPFEPMGSTMDYSSLSGRENLEMKLSRTVVHCCSNLYLQSTGSFDITFKEGV